MYEHCEVQNSEHLEKLIKEGLSFVTATSGTLVSDGMNGAYLNKSKHYLMYQQPYWEKVKPQNPIMVKKARLFMEQQDGK